MRANPHAERPVPNECLSCVWNLMFETEERGLGVGVQYSTAFSPCLNRNLRTLQFIGS